MGAIEDLCKYLGIERNPLQNWDDGETFSSSMPIVHPLKLLEKGRKPKLGSGTRFKKLTRSLSRTKGIKSPKRLAAWIGRRRYGTRKFSSLSRLGRKK